MSLERKYKRQNKFKATKTTKQLKRITKREKLLADAYYRMWEAWACVRA